jgi:triosephosphate isomerase
MTKPLIVANWKCNPTSLEGAKLLFEAVKKEVKNIKKVEIVICPPFTFLSNIQYPISNIKLGAQDCFWEEKGAFTGEISPSMLKDLGCEYVIVGHSERRRYFEETDEMINKKIKAALKIKLKPILCIGETEAERKQGKTFKILKNQIQKALNNLTIQQFSNLTIAYEPVWAIGTGKSCGIAEAGEVNFFIKKMFKNLLLYGGSVNSQNAVSYIKEAKFQGLLVGGASLNAQEFIKIVKNVAKA